MNAPDHADSQPVAVITGAGSGVGRATAELLDAEGYATVLVGRTKSKLESTAESLAQPHLVQPADISDADQCQRVIDATVDKFGRLDVLANVAGYVKLGSIADITPESWRANIDTNLSAVIYLTRAAWPVFKKQKSGVVANVSSMASTDPFPGLGAYAAAKVGVNMFTRVTGEEGEKIGVRAVCIIPGAIETPMLRSIFSDKAVPPSQALDAKDVATLIVDCITGRRRVRNGAAVTITP